ncbi:MAG: RraA family protein, partial [Planctomycetaceae bacterium]|nr:RraA family protein [Planctomycetaceae bacterium]
CRWDRLVKAFSCERSHDCSAAICMDRETSMRSGEIFRGNMTAAMQALGCVGCISNGPSRDIDEIRPMKFQYLLSGITPGHGAQAVHSVNTPVHIAGMDVAPGEIIHMDENGACKFPADRAAEVLANVKALLEEEGDRIGKLQKATTAAEIRAIFGGKGYAAGDEPDSES